MELSRVYLVGLRQRHHAKHSGYEQFRRYIGTSLRPPVNFRRGSGAFAGFVNTAVTVVTRHPRYSLGAFLTETAAALHMMRHRESLYHVIYGDSDLWMLGRVSRVTRNRLVATFHEPPAFLKHFGIDKRRIKGLNEVLLVSESQRAYFENLLPSERVSVVPHGVDTEFFCPPERMSDQPVCITVGGKLRDFETLTIAFGLVWRENPSVRVIAVGTPRDRDEHLKRLGEERVRFLNRISDHELRQAYQASRLAIFSLRDSTGNNALLEAMACGLPIVSTEVGGVAQYLGAETGILCRPRDPEGLAAAVLRLLADSYTTAKMSAASRARALEFDYRRVAGQLREVYSKVLSRGDG